MTQIEEVLNERHLNMQFIEFIEAVVRVAENLEIPHLVDDPDTQAGMEIEPEKAAEYAQRELHVKVESLILYLAKAHLKGAEGRKYVAAIREYREEEDIWANDIETGPMRVA